MGRTATTIDQQIHHLEKRGMDLDMPKEKVKEILLDIGYYRLGFYWNPFEIDDKHNFTPGTKFSDVVSLYYFDSDLRNLCSRYLNRIEIFFRTKIIYSLSNKYSDDPIWFINNRVMHYGFVNSFNDKIYTNKFIENNGAIKRHHVKHNNDRYAPAWKTIEFLTFGTVLTLFNSIKSDDDKRLVTQYFNIRNQKIFRNHMNNIVRLRNICSHGSLLYDTQLPTGIKSTPDLNIQGDDRKKLVAVIELLIYYTKKVSLNRGNDLKEAVNKLFEKHLGNSKVKEILTNKTGFKFV